MAVLDPLKLKLVNWAEVFGSAAHREPCQRAGASARARARSARVQLGHEVWIERDDFAEVPPQGLLSPLAAAAHRRCGSSTATSSSASAARRTRAAASPRCSRSLVPDTKSGTPGADAVKVKGTITWVGVARRAAGRGAPLRPAVHRSAARRRRQRLPRRAEPATASRSCTATSNRRSRSAQRDDKFQFERHGYFVADRVDHRARQAGLQPRDDLEGQLGAISRAAAPRRRASYRLAFIATGNRAG